MNLTKPFCLGYNIRVQEMSGLLVHGLIFRAWIEMPSCTKCLVPCMVPNLVLNLVLNLVPELVASHREVRGLKPD
jgi:hypothetical protein